MRDVIENELLDFDKDLADEMAYALSRALITECSLSRQRTSEIAYRVAHILDGEEPSFEGKQQWQAWVDVVRFYLNHLSRLGYLKRKRVGLANFYKLNMEGFNDKQLLH